MKKEYSSIILIILGLFAFTPLVKVSHDFIARKTFTQEGWSILKPKIIDACRRQVELKTVGDNFFEEEDSFYLFVCDGRQLVYRKEDNYSWTWGDFFRDEDFFIYNEEGFLSEIIKVWVGSPDYHQHLLEFHKHQQKNSVGSWIMKKEELDNEILNEPVRKIPNGLILKKNNYE